MPDANNHFKGQGWSRRKEANYDRAFGPRLPKLETLEHLGTQRRSYLVFPLVVDPDLPRDRIVVAQPPKKEST